MPRAMKTQLTGAMAHVHAHGTCDAAARWWSCGLDMASLICRRRSSVKGGAETVWCR